MSPQEKAAAYEKRIKEKELEYKNIVKVQQEKEKGWDDMRQRNADKE